jgi:hypothetical protein
MINSLRKPEFDVMKKFLPDPRYERRKGSQFAEQSLVEAVESFDSAVRLVTQLRSNNVITEEELLSICAARDNSANQAPEGSPKMYKLAAAGILNKLLTLHPEVSADIRQHRQHQRQ